MKNCNKCFWLRVAQNEKHTWICKLFAKYMELPKVHGWFCREFRGFGRYKKNEKNHSGM